jgi:hypothetical protein
MGFWGGVWGRGWETAAPIPKSAPPPPKRLKNHLRRMLFGGTSGDALRSRSRSGVESVRRERGGPGAASSLYSPRAGVGNFWVEKEKLEREESTGVVPWAHGGLPIENKNG